MLTSDIPRGITGIFFWGGKVIFPDFFPSVKCIFPVENSHFGRPKTNFSCFEKWKAKNEKREREKKKKGPLLFLYFSSFTFKFSTFLFSIFLLFCSIFTIFLASLYPIRQHKFPDQKSLGGHSAPCPRLLRHCIFPILMKRGDAHAQWKSIGFCLSSENSLV